MAYNRSSLTFINFSTIVFQIIEILERFAKETSNSFDSGNMHTF